MPHINAKYEFKITFEGFGTIQLNGLCFFFASEARKGKHAS